MKIRDLSLAERVLLQRRRDGFSQREAADDYGVSLYRFRQWEAGDEKPPKIALGKLADHEICFLHRVRKGTPLKQLAEELGVSRWWLCKMEYGKANTERLVDYWTQREKPWRPALAKA